MHLFELKQWTFQMSKYVQGFAKGTEHWKGRLGGLASFETITWQRH